MQTTSTHTPRKQQAPIPRQDNSGIHPVVARLFEKRGFDHGMIKEFLSWDLKSIPELTNMHDMDKAADRLAKAVTNNESVAIYGDYDVDGTTSCALLYHFFKQVGLEVQLFQPSRFVEGYGIHPEMIEKAKDKNIAVLVTVDCGITNNEAADKALELGVDLIITDHHKDARDEMPKAYAVVNPNRRDEPVDSELRTLAGVGVAFALSLQIKNILESQGQNVGSIYHLLQFAAIGTICDLAKLSNLNLRLVRHGLKQVCQTTYPGLKAFFPPEEREIGFIPSEKLSFNVGPLINSKGRLDHPEKALLLLISDDQDDAYSNYSHLELANNERKIIQGEVFKGAKEAFLEEISDELPPACIVFSENWHEGVIGIVASKLVETFKVPAIVFTTGEEEGIIKASARSAGDLNIFDCLKQLESYFVKFGGHKAAAGLSMPRENFSEFKEKFNSLLQNVPLVERTEMKSYDVEVSPSEINPNLVKSLEMLEPFGMGNEKPTFKMKNMQLDSFDILKDVHVRWFFSSKENPSQKFRGISFNYVGKWGAIHPDEVFQQQNDRMLDLSIQFKLGINRWKGREFIQLQVESLELE